MKKLLITGATGFIGLNCLEQLRNSNYEIHIVSSREETYDLKKGRFILHKANLLDYSRISVLFNEIKPTHLLHLAWYAEPGKYITSLENIRWVQTTIEIVRHFQLNGGQRAVFAGTCYEYDLSHGFLNELRTPITNRTLYGVSKASVYNMINAFSDQTGLSIAWGRIFYLYGPYEKKDRLVPYVIRSLLNEKIVKCSHGNQVRDFLHVYDIAGAFIALLESNVSGPVNIGSGIPLMLKDIILRIGSIIGKDHLIKFGEISVSPEEPPLILADNRRLKDEVGWNPVHDLDSGLKQTVEWWKQIL